MSNFRRMSISRGSIVGQGDGGSGALLGMEPLMNSNRDIANTTGGGRRLSTWRVNIIDSVDHRRMSVSISPEEGRAKNAGTIKEIVHGEDVGDDIDGDDTDEKNPWSGGFCGIPTNYFSVGLVYGGSVNLLFPGLIIQNGVSSSFYAAASSLVTVFWSYKIFFGVLSDCFPILGRRWKYYIVLGWILCAAVLIGLASMGEDVSSSNLVVMLTLANLGYVMSDVAADGFMVWMAHHEKEDRRGKIQTLIYIMREIGRLIISVVIIFGFSGPEVNCPGYESDLNLSCTTDETVASRNDVFVADPESDDWCHQVCDGADFSFGLTIPQYVWIIAAINIASIPTYFLLREEKRVREKASLILGTFWKVLKNKAVWMLILYTMVSSITFNVVVASKNNANFVWLNFTNIQQQLQSMFENIVFLAGLTMIRRYGLTWSWRKMIWCGTILVAIFNLLYLLIVFDVIRNPWFYIFTDVTDNFMVTLNFLAGTFAIVEVSEPGFEAITYALITTANNATIPLSIVISYQFMAIFPNLNTQEGLATDTPEVRRDQALLILIVEAINISSLLSLPMLVRQKKEAKEMMHDGDESSFWAKFTMISALVFLLYSTVVTFITVAAPDTHGCLKIFGGPGCTEDESSIPVYCLMGVVLLWSYGCNFYHTFLPILRGQKKFSLDMFI